MAKINTKYQKNVYENSFLDVSIPNFNWIGVSLKHFETKISEKTINDYEVIIDVSKKITTEDIELSTKIKDVFKLNFAPYSWKEKSYRFYTTERTGEDNDKKQILQNLFILLKDYENKKENDFSESIAQYNKDLIDKKTIQTNDLIIKYHEPTNQFVVLAKDFLGSEKYKILKSASDYSSQLVNSKFISPENQNKYLLGDNFFREELPNKKIEKKTYFFINENGYLSVKKLFENGLEEQRDFLISQDKISKSVELEKYNIIEENPFGLKIEYNDSDKCFDFYGKGYFEAKPYSGFNVQRNLLGLWALNFIYSEDNSDVAYMNRNYEILVDGKDKIELVVVKGGSMKTKDMKVPASEYEKISKIKANYETEMKFWGRKTKDIKISHCDFSGLDIFDRFPAIYIDDKGSCYFGFSSRRMGIFKEIGANSISSQDPWSMFTDEPILDKNLDDPNLKKKRNIKFSQTIKTIPISFDEMNYFLNDHPFADNIKKYTILLNSTIHANKSLGQDRNKIFDTLYMMAKIASASKDDSAKKPRKIKI